jgi:hypothetical protein
MIRQRGAAHAVHWDTRLDPGARCSLWCYPKVGHTFSNSHPFSLQIRPDIPKVKYLGE